MKAIDCSGNNALTTAPVEGVVVNVVVLDSVESEAVLLEEDSVLVLMSLVED